MDSRILHEDNLKVLQGLPDECIDLIYIDPPFGTGKEQTIDSTVRGSQYFYLDILTGDSYLKWLTVRLEQMHRVLTKTGSLYVHIDWRYTHKVRLILEEIFGEAYFINEIIWAYDYGGRPRDRWPKKHDTILWFAKSMKWTFNYDEIERIPYMAPGLVGPEKAARGKLPTDVWWMTIVPTNSHERTNYPNQKPTKLIERIVEASSLPGQLVADFFCGSGTTGVAANKLGRRYLMVDSSSWAVELTQKRIERGW